MINNLSVVIIAHNAEKTLPKTLASLNEFKEVIVYENNSNDNTAAIAQSFPNVTLIQGDFLGFGATKNKAASYATNEWIFSLDSDESPTKALLKELKTLSFEDKNKVYKIKRDNFFLGKKVRYSGWGKDYLIRIYNKTIHSYNDNKVHEFIQTTPKTKIQKLHSSFEHDAVTNINQFLEKIIKYSDLAAEGKKTCFFLVVLLKAHFAFFKTYFFQFGFLDGWRGFVIATSNFIGKFWRYTKRYINCKEK